MCRPTYGGLTKTQNISTKNLYDMLTEKDKTLLAERGISEDTVVSQLDRFATGFPFLRLAGSATVNNGILRPDQYLEADATARWEKFLSDGATVCKFVPASGAASRMFKALFAFVDGNEDKPADGSPVDDLIRRLPDLAFASQLDDVLLKLHGMTSAQLMAAGRYKDVIAGIIRPEGLNYGQLPKGLLTFHRYADGTTRTPLEEQLMEGAQTTVSDGVVNVHFTVSDSHRGIFAAKLEEVLPRIEEKTGLKFHVSTSVQKPATDTIAANPDGTPFRDADGNLVFRPGGHGALISNLGDIDATVVFIKNIDNVVPDSRRAETIRYKKILGGILVLVHDKIAEYTRILKTGDVSAEKLAEMRDFVANTLCIRAEGLSTLEPQKQAEWMLAKFNRPVRVCGMVRNEGEPGGGPYIAYNADGTASPQILESTQIDASKPENLEMMKRATHFNPVDLVCYIDDLEGRPFNLTAYVDSETGFISDKSQAGRPLRALELPGLWNGAMSDWNTVFVEVPISTFNPVKTVNDLLRSAHQA